MTTAIPEAPTTTEAARPAERYSKAYRGWLLGVLMVINLLNLADRQGVAATAPAIKLDLKLTDTQLGLMQGLGFAIFYTLLGLPMARLAERTSRTRIIAASVAIFGVMVASCGLVQNFWQLMLARIGVGVGDAGFGPPVASVLGDHYPREKRTSANTVVWLGAPIGAVTGAVLGGYLAQNAGWRTAYFAIGLPGLVVSLIAFLTLREPIRGMSDPVAAGEGPPPSIGTVVRFLFAKRSVRHILIGGGLAAMGMNGLGQFLSRFLVTSFHLGYAEAGRMLGLMAGAAMASGLSLGGFGMDWAAKFDRRWYVWGPAIGLAITAPFFLIGVNQTSILATVLILMFGHVSLFVYYTPTLALAQNMVGARMRASSAFIAALVLGLVGIGLGPTLVGILSDFYARQAFGAGVFQQACPGGAPPAGSAADLVQACQAASTAGIRHAIMTMSLLFVWAAVHYFLAARHLRQDLDTHYEEKAQA